MAKTENSERNFGSHLNKPCMFANGKADETMTKSSDKILRHALSVSL